jgi:predicted XRE-type DNA-binding protein
MPTHHNDNSISPSSGNVFADLGLPDADQRLAKARIAAVVGDIIARLGLSQMAAAERLGIAQPDVSNVIRGRLRGFSLERLLNFARALGNDIEIKVKRLEFEREGHLRVLVA